MKNWSDYHLLYLDKFWQELFLLNPKITFSNLRNQIKIIINEGQGDFDRTKKLLNERLINRYSIEEEHQLGLIYVIMAPEISMVKDQLNPDNPLNDKYEKLIHSYLKIANANTNESFTERYFRFMYNENSIGSWYYRLTTIDDRIVFLFSLSYEMIEFTKRSSLLDDYSDRIFQYLNDLKSYEEENSNQQDSNDKEPTNKVKGWILYFERDINLSWKKSAIKMLKERNWASSPKTLVNVIPEIQKIVLHKKEVSIYNKKDLFRAINLLEGETKTKAQKLYMELS